MPIIIKSGSSANLAGVDANNALQVTTTLVPANVGLIGLAAEVDPGTIIGRTVRTLDASDDYRLRVGVDSILFQEQFAGTAQNTNIWNAAAVTMAFTLIGGVLTLNSGSITTTTTSVLFKSYRTFMMYSSFPTYIEYRAQYVASGVLSNVVVEMGLGYPVAAASPTDGVFFRYNASAQLRGVVSYGGSETSTAPFFTNPSVNEYHTYLIICSYELVEFWVDGVLQGRIDTPVGVNAPTRSQSLPLGFKILNSGTPSSAVQLKVTQVTVSQGDMGVLRDAASFVSGGSGSFQSQTGHAAPTQLANYANSTVPTSATLSNTAAGYTTLGGQFQFAAVAGAETDYALFAYQNPAGTVDIPGKSLFITGISIDTYNTGAAVGATATILQWAVGVTSTAVSLATADAATTRSPKRIPLGVQGMPATSAIGFVCNTVNQQWKTPIAVEAGSFIHIILRMPIGLATASQVIRGVVSLNGYFD